MKRFCTFSFLQVFIYIYLWCFVWNDYRLCWRLSPLQLLVRNWISCGSIVSFCASCQFSKIQTLLSISVTFYEYSTVLQAFILTSAVFIGLTAYTYQSKRDFSKMGAGYGIALVSARVLRSRVFLWIQYSETRIQLHFLNMITLSSYSADPGLN